MKKKKLLKFISSIAMALMIIFSNTLNIFANDIYNNLESSIIKETEDIDLEEEKIVKIELDNKARNILGIEYIKVKISASYDSKNKMHVWNFNVDIPTSIFVKPPLKLKVQILRSNTEKWWHWETKIQRARVKTRSSTSRRRSNTIWDSKWSNEKIQRSILWNEYKSTKETTNTSTSFKDNNK